MLPGHQNRPLSSDRKPVGPTGSPTVTSHTQPCLLARPCAAGPGSRDIGLTSDPAALLWKARSGPAWDVCEAWFSLPGVVLKAVLCGTDQLCQQPLKPRGRHSEHNVCTHFFIHPFICSLPHPLPNAMVNSAASGVRQLGLNPSSATSRRCDLGTPLTSY